MPVPCSQRNCALHSGASKGTACSEWNGHAFDLEKIWKADPPSHDCAFMTDFCYPIVDRVLRRLPSSALQKEDVIGEIAESVLNGRAPPTDAASYYTASKRIVTDAVRERMGRMRCTACAHYLKSPSAAGGTCGLLLTREGVVHVHSSRALEARDEPFKLVPPCREFADTAQEVPPPPDMPTERPQADDAVELDVREVLAKFLSENADYVPIVGLLRGDKTHEEVARHTGLSVYQVKRLEREMLDRLKLLLKAYEGAP